MNNRRQQNTNRYLQQYQMEYQQLGFSAQQIERAFEIAIQQRKEVLDVLLQQNPQKVQPKKDETASQILHREFNFEVLPPDQTLREVNHPSGLKNIANVCYLNSLIQTYYHNPLFVAEILQFQYPLSLSFEKLIQTNESKAKRINASINLVVHLQRLFAYMVLTSRKYVDPFAVAIHVVDDFGNRFTIGDQKDLSEFNLQFLACIEEGLKYDERKVRQAEAESMNGIPENNSLRLTQSQLISLADDIEDDRLSKSAFLSQSQSGQRTQSQILAQNQSLISQLFFGKSRESVQFAEEGKMVESVEENESIFLPIILGVEHKDLYNSWEANTRVQIENYRTSKGKMTYAEKHTWITQIPESLLFQIQRVGYDPAKGLIKLNNEFRFEKEIFADRFLQENREISLRNQQQLDSLKKRKNDLEAQLLQYENFQESGLSVLEIIDHSKQFVSQNILTNCNPFSKLIQKFKSCNNSPIKRNILSDFEEADKNQDTIMTTSILMDSMDVKLPHKQPEGHDSSKSINGSENSPVAEHLEDNTEKLSILGVISQQQEVRKQEQSPISDTKQTEQEISPRSIEKDDGNMEEKQLKANRIKEALDQVRIKLEEEIHDLKRRIRETQTEIDILYGSLKKHKYVIHSILIHEGAADTGHYYAFIYQPKKNIWYKFNDIHVTEVKEEKVFKDAYGDGKSKTNAYCLIYHRVDGKISKSGYYPNYSDRLGPNLQIKSSPDPHQTGLSYSTLINQNLMEEVSADNKKFDAELQEYELLQQADMIVELYNTKFGFVNEQVRRHKELHYDGRVILPPLLNFSIYLRFAYDQMNDVVKLSILDSAIREVTNQKVTIHDLKRYPTIVQRIQYHFSNLNEYKVPTKLVVDSNVSQHLQARMEEYLIKIQSVKAAVLLLNQIENNKWKESFATAKQILEIVSRGQNEYIHLMVQDILNVQLLMITCQLFNRCDTLSNSKLWALVELIVAYSSLIRKGSIILKQIQIMLIDFYKMKAQKIFDAEILEDYTKYSKQLPECRSYIQLVHYYQDGEAEFNEKVLKDLYDKDYYDWRVDEPDLMKYQINSGLQKLSQKFKKWIQFHQQLLKNPPIYQQYDRRVQQGYHNPIIDQDVPKNQPLEASPAENFEHLQQTKPNSENIITNKYFEDNKEQSNDSDGEFEKVKASEKEIGQEVEKVPHPEQNLIELAQEQTQISEQEQ